MKLELRGYIFDFDMMFAYLSPAEKRRRRLINAKSESSSLSPTELTELKFIDKHIKVWDPTSSRWVRTWPDEPSMGDKVDKAYLDHVAEKVIFRDK